MPLAAPTTFVLGAGASCDFGFPVGADLRKEIMHAALRPGVPPAGLRTALLEAKVNADDLAQFGARFSQSGATIDAFLATHPELIPIGKLAIAAAIARHEQPDTFSRLDFKEHWLQFLLNEMAGTATTLDQFVERNRGTRFVSFNYDRCVEYFFIRTARARFKVSETAAAEALADLKPIHVYGSVGTLLSDTDAQWDEAKDGRRYLAHTQEPALSIAARSLRIIPEERADQAPEFERARQALAAAAVIVFLGFGFDATNCDRLQISNIRRGQKQIMATTMGLQAGQIWTLEQRIGGRINVSHDGNCLNGLKNFPLFT